MALSKSPSASTSAFRQSIIPAPVSSRSFLMSAAVMSAIGVPSGWPQVWAVVGCCRLRPGGLPPSSSRSQSGSGSSAPNSAPASGASIPLAAAARAIRPSATASAMTRVSSADRADRVVVARDLVVDLVGVAVRVEDRDDRDAELARLGDGDVLLLGVDDPHRARELRHVADAAERALELVALARWRCSASFFVITVDGVPAESSIASSSLSRCSRL